MEYDEENFLQLSGIQHYIFCKRQWALIHIEQQWNENFQTMDGRVMHENVHNPDVSSKRGNLIIVHAMRVHSAHLGIAGECDTVEYHKAEMGITLANQNGLWMPYPIEYKRGKVKQGKEDEAQLCAQAMCLEEMLCCDIPQGALFYGETRHRETVEFTKELRTLTQDTIMEMHNAYERGITPKVKPSKSCNSCSLKDICLPKLIKKTSCVFDYLMDSLRD